MERRNLSNLRLALAAGCAAIAVSAQAAPLTPSPLTEPNQLSALGQDIGRAVTSSDDLANLKPEQIRWHRHWHRWHRWHHWHRHW